MPPQSDDELHRLSDDELIHGLRRYLSHDEPKDPLMQLPEARRDLIPTEELEALPFADGDACERRARKYVAASGGMYGIDVAIPEVLCCGLQRGHAGEHATEAVRPFGVFSRRWDVARWQ